MQCNPLVWLSQDFHIVWAILCHTLYISEKNVAKYFMQQGSLWRALMVISPESDWRTVWQISSTRRSRAWYKQRRSKNQTKLENNRGAAKRVGIASQFSPLLVFICKYCFCQKVSHTDKNNTQTRWNCSWDDEFKFFQHKHSQIQFYKSVNLILICLLLDIQREIVFIVSSLLKVKTKTCMAAFTFHFVNAASVNIKGLVKMWFFIFCGFNLPLSAKVWAEWLDITRTVKSHPPFCWIWGNNFLAKRKSFKVKVVTQEVFMLYFIIRK